MIFKNTNLSMKELIIHTLFELQKVLITSVDKLITFALSAREQYPKIQNQGEIQYLGDVSFKSFF